MGTLSGSTFLMKLLWELNEIQYMESSWHRAWHVALPVCLLKQYCLWGRWTRGNPVYWLRSQVWESFHFWLGVPAWPSIPFCHLWIGHTTQSSLPGSWRFDAWLCVCVLLLLLLLLLLAALGHSCSIQDLVSWLGIKPQVPCIGSAVLTTGPPKKSLSSMTCT